MCVCAYAFNRCLLLLDPASFMSKKRGKEKERDDGRGREREARKKIYSLIENKTKHKHKHKHKHSSCPQTSSYGEVLFFLLSFL